MQAIFFERIHSFGVIPVIEIDSAELAVSLAETLCDSGLPIIEVTMRTEAGLESIRRIAHDVPRMLIGAGTVLNREQGQAAKEAGAEFIVSPGLDESLVAWAQKNNLPILPGAVTPTEIMRGLNLGLKHLKFFPAETLGGLKTIKALSDPFPGVRFIPTGGVRPENLVDYLQADKVHAVGGSWMAKRQLVTDRKFDEIANLTKQAVEIVKKVRG